MRRRSLAATAALAALAVPALPGCERAAEPRFKVEVVVHNCYSLTPIEVWIDGKPLALAAPAKRDDSVAVCYSGAAELGRTAEVRVRSNGRDSRIAVHPNAQARFLRITPGAPYAVLTPDPPLLD